MKNNVAAEYGIIPEPTPAAPAPAPAGSGTDDLPSDLEAERSALGCVLNANPAAAPVMLRELDPTLFDSPENRAVLDGLIGISKDGPITLLRLVEYLRAHNATQRAGGEAAVVSLADAGGTASPELNFPEFVKRLRDLATRRAAIADARMLIQAATRPDCAADTIGDAARRLLEAHAATVLHPVKARSIGVLERHEQADPGELIRNRWLCQGGAALLTGPAGIGKSALLLQFLISFAVGREMFGLIPARRLRSVIIQAENDDGDLAEMRDGILYALRLTEQERALAMASIYVHREDIHTGLDFCQKILRPIIGDLRPDLVGIDPALAYLGGDNNKQEVVGPFLRNGVNPVLHEFSCGALVNHHHSKPPSKAKEKPDWSGSDLAYLGSGSSEWANWPRAILSIRSLGSFDAYKLVCGKRGRRLGWRSPAGEPIYERFISHATDGHIYWREPEPEEAPQVGGRRSDYTPLMAANLLPKRGLSTNEWEAIAKREEGMSRSTFHRMRREAMRAGLVKQNEEGKWFRPA